MVCLACARLTAGVVCESCLLRLRRPSDRILDDGLLLRAAFAHSGPARNLVHNFKYRGIEAAGAFLAASMAPLVPKDITLVPLPRVDWRCLRYGIDPSLALARQLARIVGCRMETALSPPWFNPDQAIRSREKRRSPRFSLNRLPDGPLVLIDDVVTTGGTVRSARQALGSRVVLALSATTTPW